ncbi:class I SAM-dependent methyltransferase [Methanococcoides sp. NM1]|uniref:class I SAM-dependent methyltransferase n=1 Tax=Methanococcoides sp. NM1 TaxID=1201013 RepID=UPI00108296E1|nr:class I SAM-dependent methyltransferase [Methanococcoides sp. NM1]
MNENIIDWNEIWKKLVDSQQSSNHKSSHTSLWDSKENAERFWKRSLENRGRVEKTINELPITADSRILDIGAGPGSLAIPLAERVFHVTAVEPAKGMIDVLQENIKTYGIDNISCVNERWEDLDVENDLYGSYDVVIASFSLGMPDIQDAIRKMEAASSKYICLYWFAGESPWEYHSRILHPALYGKEYVAGPKCDVLYNVLYNMGIYPDMHVFPLEYTNRFSSIDEAVDEFRSRYEIDTQQQETILHDYLQGLLEKEDELLVNRGFSTRVKIFWEKR